MLKQSFPLALALLLITVTTVAADVDLTSVKCVVATRDAQASKSADYKKSKVYFCCTGCVGRFQKSPTKHFFLERYEEAYRLEMEAFVQAAASEADPSPNLDDGLRA
ncbi:MAG: hypothetical protein AAF539_15505, partial [Planctomycetota bacterium]